MGQRVLTVRPPSLPGAPLRSKRGQGEGWATQRPNRQGYKEAAQPGIGGAGDRGSALGGLGYGSFWLVAHGSWPVAWPPVCPESPGTAPVCWGRAGRAVRGPGVGTAPTATAGGRTGDRRTGAHPSRVQVSPHAAWEEAQVAAPASSREALVCCFPRRRLRAHGPRGAHRPVWRAEGGWARAVSPPWAHSSLLGRQAARSHVTQVWAV